MMQAKIGDVVSNDQLPKPAGSCEVNMNLPQTDEEKKAEALGLSLAKFRAAKAYAQQLVNNERAKGNKVKESTIRAKVAKKFNIKLS